MDDLQRIVVRHRIHEPLQVGVHLVELMLRSPARPATLAEVRADVERDLGHARLSEANAAFYDKLRAKYAVRIEGASPPGEPSG